MPPLHDTPILGMVARPRVPTAIEYGSDATPQGYWVEYPSGLVDVSRTNHLPPTSGDAQVEAPPLTSALLDIPVDGDRTVRVNRNSTAIVIIDMQKLERPLHYFEMSDRLSKLLFAFRVTRPPVRSQMCRSTDEGRPGASKLGNQDSLGVGYHNLHCICISRLHSGTGG